MLEIHDTLQQPILMVENKQKYGVHFIIPSSTKLLYVYSLKESQIEEQLEEEKKKDIKNIDLKRTQLVFFLIILIY